MDPKVVEAELKNHKVREGPIYKRTKFLQEWCERWMVLTMNYILIFTNRNLKELTQFVDLREVKTYKSYLRKEEDMIPAGFKIRTLEDMLYFCARNCNQKWTWIVSLERLMDFKYAGKSPYNNAEMIKTRGFMGQREFQRGKFDQPEFQETPKPEPIKTEAPKPTPQKKSEITESDLQTKMRELEEQLEKVRRREEDIIRKEKEQEEIFIFELNKLREEQRIVEERAREAERIISEGTREVVRQIYVEKNSEHPAIVTTSEQVLSQAAVEAANKEDEAVLTAINEAAEELEQTQTGTKQEQLQTKEQEIKLTASVINTQEKKEAETEKKSFESSPVAVQKSGMSKRISQMKNFFESKNMGNMGASVPQVKKEEKKAVKVDEGVTLHMCRDRVVVNLLQEFHPKAYNYPGLRYIIEFLIRVCSQRSLGYQSFLVREAKANSNRFLFAEVLLELINDFKKYDQFGSLAKVIEVLVFQVPGIFKVNHFDLIKRKLVDLVYHAPEKHNDLPILLKTLYVIHKMKSLQKDEELKVRVNFLIENMASVEGKNWGKKLVDDL